MAISPLHAVWSLTDKKRKMVYGFHKSFAIRSCLLQEPEELFEVTAQCLMSGQDRDAISGWGAIIHVM